MSTPPPAPTNNYLTFQGVGFSSGKRHGFSAMCGANPPTITGGYGNWQVIPRPLQRGLTIFQGYDPMTMVCNILFGVQAGQGWREDNASASLVERDIGYLEWMGGSNFRVGPSPVVYAWSYSNQGGQTNLIPSQYQYPMAWVISGSSGSPGIQWGQAWRNRDGHRIYQEATIKFENYLNVGSAPQAETTERGGYFNTKPGRQRPIDIAGAPTVASPTPDHKILAQRICKDPKNNPCHRTNIHLSRKGIYYQIRTGVKVWLPSHVVD